MATYIALIRKDEGTAYGVEYPDFPGCISAGDTLDEAVAGAKEALEFHVQGMREDGEEIPAPSDFTAISSRPESKGAIPVLVDVPISRKTMRINITIDESLLKKVDSVAATKGTSRSGFLAEAARLAILKPDR